MEDISTGTVPGKLARARSVWVGSAGRQPAVAGSLPATSFRRERTENRSSRQAAETYGLAARAPQSLPTLSAPLMLGTRRRMSLQVAEYTESQCAL